MFDLIVVTAANEAQAKGYRAQLKGRKNFVVVPDPGNRRVGSLGATVNVLRRLVAKGHERQERHEGQEASCLSRLSCLPRHILICHSGGDARRTPGYAAMGKAFVPRKDGRPMLDHIIAEMEKLPTKNGVTVCCGDVIPYLDSAKVAFAPTGVTGIAYPDGPWQAQRHGVYVTSSSRAHPAVGCRLSAVDSFLQKPRVTRGRFLIDTGLLHFDWKTAEKMTKLPIAGDIYEEFPKLLLEGFAPFHVSVVPKCDFFHIGSSRELLEKLGSSQASQASSSSDSSQTSKARSSRRASSTGSSSQTRTLVDACAAPIGKLGGDNIVTNVPASYGTVNLKKGECLTSLPLGKSAWYHLKYHIDDNFKSDGLWEKHGLGEKMKKVNPKRLLGMRDESDKSGKRPHVSHVSLDSHDTRVTQAPLAPQARTVRVVAPVRIDFAGGWSDTPPICYQEGGTVLAAAVTLDGRKPIEVTVRPRKDRFVRVVSKDLGKRKLLKSAAEIADHHDPHDWCCLVKSALAVTGFKFGERGLDITISADLPKGSGMGTSSNLGAATIAALIGDVDVARVGALTLKLEQEMRTGGGWEDQFAGMTPGVKIMRSKPGREQAINLEYLHLPPKFERDLKARSLLYFTGQKRMARNVLRRVLSFYADNPHNFGQVLINSVKKDAERAALAIQRGDMTTFASCVNDYWRDKKLLDAGSTNEQVDDIIDAIRPNVSAVSLAGAGGGGFMYILAKSPAAARRVRKFLEANPPSRFSRFYAFDIDRTGMTLEYK